MVPSEVASRRAADVLHDCVDAPPENELLPLLALSVLATRVPFSAAYIGSRALDLAEAFGSSGNPEAGASLVRSCAAALQRCGAAEAAADLLEGQAILRMRARQGLGG